MSRWISQHRRDQRGLTLLETLMALVVTATVLLPTLGFITLSMGEQASARTLTQETSTWPPPTWRWCAT
jgi:prepilin-type N-terminal cleavage/methylation domain-containing protein